MLNVPALQQLGAIEELRAQIPPKILAWLANTSEDTLPGELNIAIVDHLCPYMDPIKRHRLDLPGAEEIRVGGDFKHIIPAMLLIAQPAGRVTKMTPHPGDGFNGDSTDLLNTWTNIFKSFKHAGLPDWSKVEVSGMERTEMYNFIGQKVHFIIRTREREGWANVVLRLNPRELSVVVKGLLREFMNSSEQVASRRPRLFGLRGEAMQRYGHGNGVLLVSPEALKELSSLVADFPGNSSNNTVVDELQSLAKIWLPDTYPKHKDSRLQKAIGVFGAGGVQLEFPQTWLQDHLENKLQGGELMQRLSLKELGHYLSDDPRQVFITECTKETGKIAVLVTNGISGANGGLG